MDLIWYLVKPVLIAVGIGLLYLLALTLFSFVCYCVVH
jgi:uncharacterized membrane protein YvlD (DUF360 family)